MKTGLKFLTKKSLRLFAFTLCLAVTIPQAWADDYYVLSSATTWDYNSLYNDSYKMTSSDNEWTWSFTPTSSGDFFFRIIGRWSGGWYDNGIGADYDQKPITTSYQNTTWTNSNSWKLTVTAGTTYTLYMNSSNQVKYSATEPDSYVVAGSPASVFGAEWDGTYSPNTMTQDGDGQYTLTLGNVTLTAATEYEYKVVNRGSQWIGDSDGNNLKFAVPLNGSYDVTFTFDPSSETCVVTYNLLTATGGETYTVAGSNATILGSQWAEANSANDMTLQPDGTYLLTLNNIELTDNNPSCQFKVVVNHSWVINYPTDNASVTGFDGSGTYNIVFTYNPTNHDVTGVATKQAIATTYYAMGDDTSIFTNGWNTGAGTALTDNGDGTYSWTSGQVQLTAGNNYQYKVYGSDDSWHPSGDNATFQVGLSGTYTVTIIYNEDGDAVEAVTTLVDAGNIYIEGSAGLGLTWSPVPTQLMTLDSQTGIYSYTYEVAEAGTYNFVFANGQGANADDWDNFNANYRIGPSSGSQAINLDGTWHTTQMASGDNGSYRIAVEPGTLTIYFNPIDMTFKVEGNAEHFTYTFYVLPDNASITPHLYLWGINDIHYTSDYPGNRLIDSEVLADGNTWYKMTVTITTDFINAIVSAGGQNADDTKTKDITYIDPGTYYIYWTTDRNTAADILYDENNQPIYTYNHYEMYNDPPTHPGGELYLIGNYTYSGEHYDYSPSQAVRMKYDGNTGSYYLNNVTLNNNTTFCFSDLLGGKWEDLNGHRYGNGGTEGYTDNPDGTNYLEVDASRINRNMPLAPWSDFYGEYRMFTSGIFNVLVNPDQHWVKLIKTDNMTLTPMNIYLEQTSNVKIDNVQEPKTTYTAQMFDGGYWPLSAYNAADLGENWDPYGDNHYGVYYVGDTTTVDGKKWWHWEVTASICEFFFTRTNKEPYQSSVIRRKSGAQWITWDEVDSESTMTDHTREYFEAAANALPSNVVVMEGHYYVYFINTVGWENVYCYAWDNNVDDQGNIDNFYADGYSRVMSQWPGKPCERIGIDPVTGYEVWRYDFGTIAGTDAPNGGIIFNDGNQDQQSQVKEQTGDFEYINGGVYDYLGLFDGAYTLNNLIRTASMEVRYTVSNDLVGVYYDDDTETEIHYTDINGEPAVEVVKGALYAKDMNQYGEKSYKPDASYSDYVYDICYATNLPGGSQVMQKKTTYDQSNWIKLVISPNYDGGDALPVAEDERPDLRQFEGRIIPAGKLELFMTDTINPTGHVVNISVGETMAYEPNVYVPYSFNDSYVFTYTHQDWEHEEYQGVYLTRPVVTWNTNDDGKVVSGTVVNKPDESRLYKMFYVAPKPQEVAYVTWIVYDNNNINQEYPGYDHSQYQTYSPVASFLPEDPGRFYAPSNWNRSITISSSVYKDVQYLDYEEWENYYHQRISDVSNGYMQLGGVKVNWSLFDEEKVGMPWWQIFQPGQAYKLKAIVRYAHDNSGNVLYEPSNGYIDWDDHGNDARGTVLNAPRRTDSGANGQGGFANMYFTSDYDMEDSKFILFPIEASADPAQGSSMGNVTTVTEVAAPAPTVTGVRYYNLMGVGSDKPHDGINIVVTTYSDGSRTSRKVLR